MTSYVVGRTDELAEGDRVLVELEGKDVGVFNIDGEYYAYVSWCAHQGGPVCEGSLTGTTEASFDRERLETTVEYVREDEILCCPWHGWEFDVTSGECLSRAGCRLPSYEVTVRDGDIVVDV
jgi:nitrite reductase/ring-hydroxylating ferredoxin subunit